jgi:hypothetical protein
VARPARREGIGKGGRTTAFALRQRESGDGVRARPRERREKERGGLVRRGAVWREGGVGEGAWWPTRRTTGGGGRRSVTCEQGRGRMARMGHVRGCGTTRERRELGRAREKQCDFFI